MGTLSEGGVPDLRYLDYVLSEEVFLDAPFNALIHANRDLLAWIAVSFFPNGSRALLRRHQWHIPYRLLIELWPLMISNVQMR